MPKNGECITNGGHQVKLKLETDIDLKKHPNDRSIAQSNIHRKIQCNIGSAKKYSKNILDISNISNIEEFQVLKSDNLTPNPPPNTSSYRLTDRKVSGVEKIKSVVCLPNPMNGLSPQSDKKQKMPSSRKKQSGRKKNSEENSSLTPITRFFTKKEEILPKLIDGKSNSNGVKEETF